MSKHILIIEDEEIIVELLRVNLEAHGYKVTAASTGEEALIRLFVESVEPDIIILDVRLPGINGWNVCKRIKYNERTKGIPVVFLTAASQKRDVEKAKEVGGDLFLTKPFNPLSLVETITGMLNKTANAKK